MRSRGLLMLFIAAIAGLAAVVMAARWMQGQNGNQGRIAIANADIELGGRISREMVRMADWPQGSVPAGAFEDPAALEGRVVLVIGIHHRDMGRGRRQHAFDCGGGQAAAADALDHPDTRMTQGDGAGFVRGAVRAVIIDEDRFPGDAIQRLFKPLDQRT